jgi:tRNA pseudouridine55 synthase
MDGLFLVNKPPRLTSHDVVQEVRKILRIQKVGHFGTLDPMATGLMIVAVGKATRFFPYYSKLDKVYQGQIAFEKHGGLRRKYQTNPSPVLSKKIQG